MKVVKDKGIKGKGEKEGLRGHEKKKEEAQKKGLEEEACSKIKGHL
jgi:hypothetical protein